MESQLALEFVRVTEAAALQSSQWTGRGDKNSADEAATVAIRTHFNAVSMDGIVVIGEGEMDEAPMLYIGERVGNRRGPAIDIAVDPLEGTETVANGLNNALSVIAAAPRGNLLHAPDMYMQKMAVGPALAGKLSLDDPIPATLSKAARILGKSLPDLTVSILDRTRHAGIIKLLRESGVRIKLLGHGDVMGAIETCLDNGVDLHIGSGGAPEGVLAAAALKCMGGEIQGRLLPDSEEEVERCKRMGIMDPGALLSMTDMVGRQGVMFVATGVTPGEWLQGVRSLPGHRAETHSVVMHSETKTIRFVRSIHHTSDASGTLAAAVSS
ncbi:class II fructose-bisphosphatase [Paenibacillus farraposensis]|uniref:Fructose-1,6-bisphosphatase n=1 Tax=Paenibacillus farraposensis TaxID=2807095 RepID=A0ABW4DJH4_9BACL|nr:class II fructose-bisphosphatase [Paenibacillus farraposensis]MCC3379555.1 class II fructose-bisphosphatase [Paenibacillus farraposensis]